MRWLRVVLLVVVLFGVVGFCSPVRAANPTVTVTVRAWVVGTPTFTLTYISDFDIRIDWVPGPAAVNTMIRAAYGHSPADRTDGYLVYSGNATTFNDTAVDMSTPSIVYYKAWSQDAGGVWSDLFASGDTGGLMSISWFLMVIVLMGLVLWLVAVVPRRKNLLVSTSAFILWLGIGFWWLIGDIFTTMGMVGDYVNFFYYIPFILAFGSLLEYMTRANQVEISRTIGGKTFSEFGTPPKSYESNYDRYKAQLQSRTRKGRRGY